MVMMKVMIEEKKKKIDETRKKGKSKKKEMKNSEKHFIVKSFCYVILQLSDFL